ncbi:N-acetylmuramoyl-L-alanine amidase [Dokdonia sp.]|uniref:N-acetylmuramoyl-L-alanine amidase family protein n=1 Tax=Dokdonia sp. TaxID=2024995 RepID=UPI003266821E
MKQLLTIIGMIALTLMLSFTTSTKRTIVIDVGHGGKDAGKTAHGIHEKEVVLRIAHKIKELNKDANIDIILTRDSDTFVTLKERTAFINSLAPEFVISLHTNAYHKETVKGNDIYISDNNSEKEKSTALALKIKDALKEQNRGIKKANFHLLKNVTYPIVLAEIGFLSNEKDRQQLTSEEGISEIAQAIYTVIQQ